MAYTQTARKAKTSPNNFAGLKTDSNRVAMTGAVGNIILTQDATGTPVVSPVTVNTTQTLVVPQTAVSCSIIATTNPVQISEDSTQAAFFTIPAGVIYTFDCADMQNIYLKTGSSTVVNFLFKAV
jgi:hypothetical protein